MVVGALLDLGISKETLIEELNKLKLSGYKIKIKKVTKKGIRAIRFIVNTRDQKKERNLNEIYGIIDKSFLDKKVKLLSKRIFLNLAKAEAKVHESTVNRVHFHEVGAVDSIIDIVATAILINKLKPQKIYASLSVGTLIYPAAKKLLEDTPLTVVKINEELITPTGATILKTVVDEFIDDMDIKVIKRGYGAGKRNLKIPNVLEATLGTIKMEKNKLVILETNIDDMNPQFYAFVIDRLLKAGAREAFIQPIIMKKNRLGILLTTICDEKIKDKLIEMIFDETTTFGVRVNSVSRICLDRKFKKIITKYGPINVKIGKYKGKIRTVSPEYEDCKKAAKAKNTPLKRVYGEAKRLVDNF